MLAWLNIRLQFVLPHHAISRFVGWVTRIRWRWFKNTFTSIFVAGFKPDLSDAENPDPYAYEHFNAFFLEYAVEQFGPAGAEERCSF